MMSQAQNSSDHNLFVGVNLSVPQNETFYSVEGISGQNLIYNVDGQKMTQPIGECGNIKFTKISKVSPNFLEVTDVICKSDYSMEADPAMRAARTHIVLANAAAQATSVQNISIRAQQELQGTSIGEGSGPGAGAAAGAAAAGIQNELQSVQSALNQSMSAMSILPGDIGEGDFEDNGHDILRLEFTAKALKNVPDPTVFIILDLKETPNSDTSKSWFQFAKLNPISTSEHEFSLMTPSFPDGMYIDAYELYFFSEGTEIASSLSEKRVAVPRKDAKSYLNFQYIDSHERETRPGSLVWKTMRKEDFSSSKDALLETVITLNIDGDGNVTAVHVPKTVAGQMDEDTLQSIRALMFYPALEKGEPVESKLKLKLSDLIL